MTSRPPAPSRLLYGLVLLGSLLLAATPIEAQAVVRFGSGNASLAMPIMLDVPIRLKISAAGSERVVERTAEYTEIELPVRVDANISWSLTVALGAARELGPVLVLSVSGDWVELLSIEPRATITGRDPANAAEVKLRLRLPASMESTAALRLRLSLVPAEIAGS